MNARKSHTPVSPSANPGKYILPIGIVAATLSLIFVGCGSNNSAPPPPPPAGPPKPVAAKASASASASAPTVIAYTESDFTESDSSRDPFHPFAQVIKPTGETKVVPQYQVVLEKYAIDELKLTAIVNAGDGPKAMFVDPTGKGWIVMRGMHVGRGEMVKLGAGATTSYPLYWKVDRIKPTEVVLVREDTLHPEVQPTYREIPLHPEGEKT
jgi:type IV pilus assembly protein PilP